jgi:hypothetical protein
MVSVSRTHTPEAEENRMSTAKLIRWGGLALALGGIAFAVHLITHPPGETAPYAFWALWVPSHLLGGIAALLISLGLVGLYLRQSEKVGLAGLIGFVLAFVGITLSAGASIFISVALIPFLAFRGMDSLVDPKGPLIGSSAMKLAIGLPAISLVIGFLILAIVTLRARVLPPLGAWLIILTIPLAVVGSLLVFVIGTSFQGIIGSVLGVSLGLGLAAWGWALWSEKAAISGRAAA